MKNLKKKIDSSIKSVKKSIEELNSNDNKWTLVHVRIDINLHDALYKLQVAKKELKL